MRNCLTLLIPKKVLNIANRPWRTLKNNSKRVAASALQLPSCKHPAGAEVDLLIPTTEQLDEHVDLIAPDKQARRRARCR